MGRPVIFSFDDVIAKIVEWQRRTFPGASRRSIVLHLATELGELATAASIDVDDIVNAVKRGASKSPGDIETESADVLILLVALADVEKFRLRNAVLRKHARNIVRRWNDPVPDQPTEHKKEGDT